MGCCSVWQGVVNKTGLQALLCFLAMVRSPIKTWYLPENTFSSNAQELENFLHRSKAARKYLLLLLMLTVLLILYLTWFGFLLLVHQCQTSWLDAKVLLRASNRQEQSPPKI